MMTDDDMRAALYGRNLAQVARDAGISYDALYRFTGKPLQMFDRVALADYLQGLQGVAISQVDDGSTIAAQQSATIAPEMQAEARRRHDSAMEHSKERQAFEVWMKQEDQAEPEPERTYELDEDGMNQLTEDCMWIAWQVRASMQKEGA